MTSKLSFINLRRENIKHRLGMILVTYFFFFMSMLVYLMQVQNICGVKDDKLEKLRRITDLSYPEMGMGLMVTGAAVLLAISSFRYLHSKTETDFYHSLPVRRRKILYLLLTNDFLLFVVPLALVSAFKCIVAAGVGYFSGGFLVNILWSVVCYAVIFAAVYLTMSLAMIVTGNTFVGMLGFCVFSGYSPVMLYYLYPFLASTFFTTYCGNDKGAEFLNYLSPASLTGMLLTFHDVWNWREHTIHLAVIIVWITVLLIINYLLFERRPSEMAGKAMAFPAWNPVIRFLLVIPGAVYAGLVLYAVSFTSFKPWIIAGVIIGGFLCHGVIECIYRFDVRGLWANKRQMLASIAVSFAIVGFFWADISGYDRYLPEAEELDSIGLENLTISFFWGREKNGVSGETMEGELEILDEIVRENDGNTDIYNNYNGSVEDYRGYVSWVVRYKLKNGSEVRRQYTLSPELKDKLMEQVFDTMEYKKDMYSLYTADWSLVTDVRVSYPVCSESLNLTEEQRSELFKCYLEDHSALDYQTVKTTLPFGQLTITHRFGKDTMTENGQYYNLVMEDTEPYYLYPSFKKTIEFLREELNVDLKTSMEDVTITHLEASRYNESTEAAESLDIYDEEFIDSIKDRLCYGEEIWIDEVEAAAADESIGLTATILTESGEESYVVYTDSETLERIKKQGTFE